MSSVVFNASAVGKAQLQQQNSSVSDLFPTTIGSATKMYQRYQHIMPAPAVDLKMSSAGTTGVGGGLTIKTRKYTPRGMALASSGNYSSSSSTSSTCSNSSVPASGIPYNVDQSQSVQRRNARERNRVKQVNNSFARLRQHIPQTIIADLTKGGGRGPHKKISKVDTLRIAVEYIRRLQDLVDDLNGGPSNTNANNNLAQLNLCLDDDTSSNSSGSSSNSSNNLYYNNAALMSTTPTPLQQQQQLQRQQFPNHPLTAISLNGNTQPSATVAVTAASAAATMILTGNNTNSSCHSPTSSFNSNMSFDSGTYEAAPQQFSPSVNHSSATAQLDAQLQLKFEPYEHFQLDEEDCTPDDEEILDYISLWQEQ